MDVSDLRAEFDERGFALVGGALDGQQRTRLVAALATVERRGRAGARDLFRRLPTVEELARSARLRGLVEAFLGPEAFAVRALFFDKAPAANWAVPWHRDRLIAVRERIEARGFGPWSVKDGVPHVEPPRAVLDGMLTLRLHLDAVDQENGPLRVIPGSHRDRDLVDDDLGRAAITCLAPVGSALLLRPLLLHASLPARSPRHRRVLHLEFAAAGLPAGLAWQERIG